MTDPAAPLAELARAYGVMTEYVDWRGRPVTGPAETIEAVLAALGVDVDDPAAALADYELAPWRRLLPPSLVTIEGETPWVPVHVPDGDPVTVSIELESGGTRPLA